MGKSAVIASRARCSRDEIAPSHLDLESQGLNSTGSIRSSKEIKSRTLATEPLFRYDAERSIPGINRRASVSPAPPGFAKRSNFPLRRRVEMRPGPMESQLPAGPSVCRVAWQNAQSDHAWPDEWRGPIASLQEWPFQKEPEPARAAAGLHHRQALPRHLVARGRASAPPAPPRFRAAISTSLAAGGVPEDEAIEATGPALAEAA